MQYRLLKWRHQFYVCGATLCQVYELCLHPTTPPCHTTYIKKHSPVPFEFREVGETQTGGDGTSRMLMVGVIPIVVHGAQFGDSEQLAVS